jgi:hypothetical protein
MVVNFCYQTGKGKKRKNQGQRKPSSYLPAECGQYSIIGRIGESSFISFIPFMSYINKESEGGRNQK